MPPSNLSKYFHFISNPISDCTSLVIWTSKVLPRILGKARLSESWVIKICISHLDIKFRMGSQNSMPVPKGLWSPLMTLHRSPRMLSIRSMACRMLVAFMPLTGISEKVTKPIRKWPLIRRVPEKMPRLSKGASTSSSAEKMWTKSSKKMKWTFTRNSLSHLRHGFQRPTFSWTTKNSTIGEILSRSADKWIRSTSSSKSESWTRTSRSTRKCHAGPVTSIWSEESRIFRTSSLKMVCSRTIFNLRRRRKKEISWDPKWSSSALWWIESMR